MGRDPVFLRGVCVVCSGVVCAVGRLYLSLLYRYKFSALQYSTDGLQQSDRNANTRDGTGRRVMPFQYQENLAILYHVFFVLCYFVLSIFSGVVKRADISNRTRSPEMAHCNSTQSAVRSNIPPVLCRFHGVAQCSISFILD